MYEPLVAWELLKKMKETDKKIVYYPTIGKACSLSVRIIFYTTVAEIFFYFFGEIVNLEKNEIYNSSTQLLFVSMVYVGVIFLAKRRIKKTSVWEHRWKWKKTPIGLFLLLIPIVLALDLIISLMLGVIQKYDFIANLYHPPPLQYNVFSFLLVVIAAPILEELCFRGVFLEAFLKNYSVKKSIIWSAVIFGVVHLYPLHVIIVVFYGILWGWLYVKTNSLLPGIFAHFVTNLSAYLSTSLIVFEVSDNNKWLFAAIALLIIFAGLRIIDKKMINPGELPA